jgi:hypothetical protein
MQVATRPHLLFGRAPQPDHEEGDPHELYWTAESAQAGVARMGRNARSGSIE